MNVPIKILVVGNSGVGKTSLCNRYVNDIFIRSYKPTVGGNNNDDLILTTVYIC